MEHEITLFFIVFALVAGIMWVVYLWVIAPYNRRNCQCDKYALYYDTRKSILFESYMGAGRNVTKKTHFIGISAESCIDDFTRFINDHYSEVADFYAGNSFDGQYMKKLFEYYKQIRP